MRKKHFTDRLVKEIKAKKSHVVVGLDPDYGKIPSYLKDKNIQKYGYNLKSIAKTIFDFNRAIIDTVFDLVPAIKPQIAFYEKYGLEGIKAFVETVKYGKKKGLIVIEDAKRNDIGITASAYSNGHLGRILIKQKKFLKIFDVDAITINPYLGSDTIIPFIKDIKQYNKGIFVLVKTSNPSSIEFQDLLVTIEDKVLKLYEVVANYVNKWGKDSLGVNGYSAVGAVVGATFPKEAKILRKLMPHAYFLVPGYGAQGGKAKDVVGCFNLDGYGAIISASRSIIYAYQNQQDIDEENFAQAARAAVIKMNEEINQELKALGLLDW
ncbi:MAG TPA: orotidine-5'-phosphate decarboxylase [Candidatus Atribacteria bacterium]|nr:orotidine-5'-phosphate decarboxylase [Candidatus Atribacteria bacterium]